MHMPDTYPKLSFRVLKTDEANIAAIRSLGGAFGDLASHTAVIRLALQTCADVLKAASHHH
jgi:hypothetical protein